MPYIKLKVYGQTVLLDGGPWPDCPPPSLDPPVGWNNRPRLHLSLLYRLLLFLQGIGFRTDWLVINYLTPTGSASCNILQSIENRFHNINCLSYVSLRASLKHFVEIERLPDIHRDGNSAAYVLLQSEIVITFYFSWLWLGWTHVQGAANKSNPLPCFVNILTTNLNFYKKIYATISHSYLHITAKLCCIITTFD